MYLKNIWKLCFYTGKRCMSINSECCFLFFYINLYTLT